MDFCDYKSDEDDSNCIINIPVPVNKWIEEDSDDEIDENIEVAIPIEVKKRDSDLPTAAGNLNGYI